LRFSRHVQLGGDPWEERPRIRRRDYISQLACERLGIPQNELESVAGEREVWVRLLVSAASATRPRIKRMKMDGWMDGYTQLQSGSSQGPRELLLVG